MIVEAVKFQDLQVNWEAADLGRAKISTQVQRQEKKLMLQFKGQQAGIILCGLVEGQPWVLCRLATDWMGPTRTGKAKLLYPVY